MLSPAVTHSTPASLSPHDTTTQVFIVIFVNLPMQSGVKAAVDHYLLSMC
jgi:hypothetical protein